LNLELKTSLVQMLLKTEDSIMRCVSPFQNV
jgi:hypothetical protein